MGEHSYALTATWRGNRGGGTTGYRDYDRNVEVEVAGKPVLQASADSTFRGDPTRWNPEDLLLAAIAECHLLSYLHACVTRGVVVTAYTDDASATMRTQGNGGAFVEAVLRPHVIVRDDAMVASAIEAHHDAHEWCFIANSVNFPIRIEPDVRAT